jgi:hypothetical protein
MINIVRAISPTRVTTHLSSERPHSIKGKANQVTHGYTGSPIQPSGDIVTLRGGGRKGNGKEILPDGVGGPFKDKDNQEYYTYTSPQDGRQSYSLYSPDGPWAFYETQETPEFSINSYPRASAANVSDYGGSTLPTSSFAFAPASALANPQASMGSYTTPSSVPESYSGGYTSAASTTKYYSESQPPTSIHKGAWEIGLVSNMAPEMSAYLEARAVEVRSALVIQKKRNIAVLNYNIDGISGEILGVSGEIAFDGTAPVPSKRLFATIMQQGSGITHTREFDSEIKVLTELAQKIRLDSKGEINMYSHWRQPCRSCAGVINQFKEMFPEIKVNLGWNVGG